MASCREMRLASALESGEPPAAMDSGNEVFARCVEEELPKKRYPGECFCLTFCMGGKIRPCMPGIGK